MPQINLALLLAAIFLVAASKFCTESSACSDETICLNSSCRQCEADIDCWIATQFTPACKRSGNGPGICKECTNNKYCQFPSASRCSENNTCTSCLSNTDCIHLPGRKKSCLSGECVECISQADCASGYCINNRCQGPPCLKAQNCIAFPTLPYCDTFCQSCGNNPSFCKEQKKICHPEGSCEECWVDVNCFNSTKSKCSNKTCIGCQKDWHCAHIYGKSKCEVGKGCVECKTKSDCGPGKFCFDNMCIASGKDLQIKIFTQESPFSYTVMFPYDLIVNANIQDGTSIQLVNVDDRLYSYTLTRKSDVEYQINFKVTKTIFPAKLYLVFTYYSLTESNPEPRPQWVAFARTKRMPYIPEEQAAAIEDMKNAGETTVITFTATTGAFVACGANPILLWAFINLLQTFYYLSFISVNYPGNVLFFFKIFTVANFDFIPNPLTWFDPNIEEESLPAPDKFLEYDVDGLFLNNAGNLLLVWVLVVLLYISAIIFVRYLYRISRLTTLMSLYMIRWFKWSGVIRTLVTSYPQIIQAAFLQIRTLNTDAAVYSVSSVFGVFFTGFAFLFPLGVYFMIRKLSRTPAEFNKKYTALIEEFKVEGQYSKYFTCIFMTKRLIIILCLVFLNDSPFLQIVLLIGLNITTIVMLCKYQPYVNRIENIVNTLNEILFTLVHLLIFALVHDDDVKQYSEERRLTIGWSIVGMCTAIAVISLGLSIIEMYGAGKEIWRTIKKLKKKEKEVYKPEHVKIEPRSRRSKKVAPAPAPVPNPAEESVEVELKDIPPELAPVESVVPPEAEVVGEGGDTLAHNMSLSTLYEISYKKRRVDREDTLRGSHMLDHIRDFRGVSFETDQNKDFRGISFETLGHIGDFRGISFETT